MRARTDHSTDAVERPAACEAELPGATRPPAITVALAALIATALLYTAHVTVRLGGTTHEAAWNHWVYDGVIGSAALLCLLRARTGAERLAWACIGGALCIYWLGDLYWNSYDASLADPPDPSLADAGWLAYYLPLYAGLMLLLRSRISRLPASTWLEGLVGALALGSVAATVVFDPVVASTHGSVSTVLTNLAYPTLDVLLLALVAGGLVVLGARAGRSWMLLGLGLLTAGLADTAYLLQSASGTYQEGGWVNAGWPLAFTLMALAAWTRSPEIAPAPAEETSGLGLLSSLFASLVLGLLAYTTFEPVPAVAHALLTLAVLCLFARVGLAARERQLLARRTEEAHSDDLTGLANRRLLYELLDEALPALPLSLVFVDLDRFLDLTDTLGRRAGTELIVDVAERLKQLQPADSVLARVGDDEFVFALRGPAADVHPTQLAHAVADCFQAPFALDGLLVNVRPSIGVALAPEHAQARSALMRCADIAMRRARAHRSTIETYEPEGDDYGRDHLRLISELRQAIAGDGLVLRYQPKIALPGRSPAGAEVLVRWEHPRHGLLGPDRFVPLAEREGMMRELTLVVLDQALAQQAEWRRRGVAVPLAVNLSPSNLIDARLPADIGALMRRHGTPPGAFELEITEETVMRDPGAALDMIARIGELGVEFSLDDFGTGYSSLEQLRRLPVRTLKIDRSFVMEMTECREDERIVRSVVALAHSLDLLVVAEGVETAAHLETLAALGCDLAQGYHVGRPLSADSLERWLSEQPPQCGGASTNTCAPAPAAHEYTDQLRPR
jgi:diguanylate cyclase (GGDEF)-like protein